jgi:hypothetical protein
VCAVGCIAEHPISFTHRPHVRHQSVKSVVW